MPSYNLKLLSQCTHQLRKWMPSLEVTKGPMLYSRYFIPSRGRKFFKSDEIQVSATYHTQKKKPLPEKIKKVIFIPNRGIGDVLSLVPALNALKNTYPHIKIALVIKPSVVSLLEGIVSIDQILTLPEETDFIEDYQILRPYFLNTVLSKAEDSSEHVQIWQGIPINPSEKFALSSLKSYIISSAHPFNNTSKISDMTVTALNINPITVKLTRQPH
jgi:hypothetical protein